MVVIMHSCIMLEFYKRFILLSKHNLNCISKRKQIYSVAVGNMATYIETHYQEKKKYWTKNQLLSRPSKDK